MASGESESTSQVEVASWWLAAVLLLLVLRLNLLPALLAGFLVYELVHIIAPLLERQFSGQRSRIAAVVVLAVLVISLLIAIALVTISFRSETAYPAKLFEKIAAAVQNGRDSLPGWLADWLPGNPDARTDALQSGLREHARELELAGMGVGRLLAGILVGMVIGAMIAVGSVAPPNRQKPLARALLDRLQRFGDSFRSVVFAQSANCGHQRGLHRDLSACRAAYGWSSFATDQNSSRGDVLCRSSTDYRESAIEFTHSNREPSNFVLGGHNVPGISGCDTQARVFSQCALSAQKSTPGRGSYWWPCWPWKQRLDYRASSQPRSTTPISSRNWLTKDWCKAIQSENRDAFGEVHNAAHNVQPPRFCLYAFSVLNGQQSHTTGQRWRIPRRAGWRCPVSPTERAHYNCAL